MRCRSCLLLAEFEPDRWPRAIARWHARFVLEAPGMTVDDAALALSAANALTSPRNGEIAAETLRHLAQAHGLASVAALLREPRREGSAP